MPVESDFSLAEGCVWRGGGGACYAVNDRMVNEEASWAVTHLLCGSDILA